METLIPIALIWASAFALFVAFMLAAALMALVAGDDGCN